MEDEKAEGKNIQIYQPEGEDEEPILTEDQSDIEDAVDSEIPPEPAEINEGDDALEEEDEPESDDESSLLLLKGKRLTPSRMRQPRHHPGLKSLERSTESQNAIRKNLRKSLQT